MLVDFSIIPVGGDVHTSEQLAEALRVVDASGLPHQLTPSGTCIEGDWNQVMHLVRQCHDRVRQFSQHVVTIIKIEDDADASEKIRRNVESIEQRIGHPIDNVRVPRTQGGGTKVA